MNSIFFWQIFAGVLLANLLTVGFVWSAVNLGRRERAMEKPGVYAIGLILPICFAFGAVYLALGGT